MTIQYPGTAGCSYTQSTPVNGQNLTLAPNASSPFNMVDTNSSTIFNIGDGVTASNGDPLDGTFIGTVTYQGIAYPVIRGAGSPIYYYVGGIDANFTGVFQATSLACFCEGTLIRTTAGDIPVELLRESDVVVTASGGKAPIVWLGHRIVLAGDAAQNPIRIRAACLGAGLPVRDLFVSPEHALFLDGVLVPALHLVNGDTIAQVPMDTVVYHHVMLDRHEVILAEGLPVESLLDEGDFDRFDNGHTAPSAAGVVEPCAPRITQGPRLADIRARLNDLVTA